MGWEARSSPTTGSMPGFGLASPRHPPLPLVVTSFPFYYSPTSTQREEFPSKGKRLLSLQERICDRTTPHGDRDAPGSSSTEKGAKSLPSPSEQGTAAAPTASTKNVTEPGMEMPSSQPKPRLLLPEPTLDVTCCLADTHHQPRRRHKRRASPTRATRQEATPKYRVQAPSGYFRAFTECSSLPELVPVLSHLPLHANSMH